MPTINKKPGKKYIQNKSNVSYKYYNTKLWYFLRKEILNEQIFCQDCLKKGRYVKATDVHHIIPFMSAFTPEQQYNLFKDPNNLVALCDSCHHIRHSKKDLT